MMEFGSTQKYITKFANLLYGVAFFNIFSIEELIEIVRETKFITMQDMKNGTKIFSEGEYDRNFFILMRGKIDLRKKMEKSGEESVGTINKGEVFGELVITDPAQPRRASAYVAGKDGAVLAKINAMLVDNAISLLRMKFLKKFLDLILNRINKDARKIFYLQKIITFAGENNSLEQDDFFLYSIETAISERNRITQYIKYTDYLVSMQLDPEKSESFIRDLLERANRELDNSLCST